DQTDSVIYMNTFSKSFMPSLRFAYMVVPERLLANVREANIGNSCSALMQEALYHFIEKGYWFKHIRRMRKIYRNKLDLLKSSLNQHFGNKIEIDSADTGIRLLISFSSSKPEEFFFETALKQGILLKRLNSSWYNQQATKRKKLFMIGFGNVENEKINLICERLAFAWLVHID
ncbi:MAG: aminotransferase class I/II-fold pyridoxal phosphate-dependent enzyme, partial [Calditrichaeota bacterium]|nr:aminotransferase class I/II-fold pyridoxal phosphate-dependent enzyme [Calditrichota bacterium]